MAIYKPKLELTKADREALALLGQIAISSEASATNNLSDEMVMLSPAEASRLLELLEQFATSKLFIEGSYFAEGIVNGQGDRNPRLREIYLAWRSRRGHSRVASGFTWREFVFRAGFQSSNEISARPRGPSQIPLRPMSFEHFLAMERKLAEAAQLHPRVRTLVLAFVESASAEIGSLKAGRLSVEEGLVRGFVKSTVNELALQIGGREKAPMSRKKVIALSTIIMDTAAMFTTRDWTATGVISTIAAAVPDALGER